MLSDVDITVAGGGLAGVAAAMSAAHCGARVRLVESAGRIGGNVGHAQVHTLCGLYHPPVESAPPVLAHTGWVRSLVKELRAAGGAGPPRRLGRVWVLPVEPAAVVATMEFLLGAQPGLKVCTGCLIENLERHDDGFVFQSSRESWQAKRVLDCTGGGFLADRVGLEKLPTDSQVASFIVGLRSKGLGRVQKHVPGLAFSAAIRRAADQGELPEIVRSVSWMVVSEDLAMLTVHLPDPGREGAPSCDEVKRAVSSLLEWLPRSFPAWPKEAEPVWPDRVGVRESGHIRGKVILRRDDWENEITFPDTVAVNTWPSEIWKNNEGARFLYFPAPAPIPLRALVAAGDGFFGMAGRCISTDPVVAGAIRILGTAMATGQAVGVAAALSVDKGCQIQEVSSREVLQALENYIPHENHR
jgi:hypothetical protein